MKSEQRNTKVYIATAIGVFLVGLTAFVRRQAEVQQKSSISTEVSVKAESLPSTELKNSSEPVITSAQTADILTKSGNPPSADRTPESKAQRLAEVLQVDRKALRTAAENDLYHSALSSVEQIAFANDVLSTIKEPSSPKELLEDQTKRMDAALFLTRAIEWSDNPSSSRVKEVIERIVLDDAVRRASDIELKKSLAADRIELFANLKKLDEQTGRSIEARATSDMSKKIILFANNFYRLNSKNGTTHD